MSDNLRRYLAIRNALRQWYPANLNGHQSRHLITLAMLISGIVGCQHTHLDKVAAHVPTAAKPPSRTKRFARWVANDAITSSIYSVPFAEVLLASLAHRQLVLVLDGSAVGRGCVALMLSVLYRGRALPVTWIVAQGRKGHFAEQVHLELLQHLVPLLPPQAKVLLLGDGEFDGLAFQQMLTAQGWTYVCRTASNLPVRVGDDWLVLSDLASPGRTVSTCADGFTHQDYGPVTLIAWWASGAMKPLYLVTNLELAAEACQWYRKRFHIETFFSDQKSRGFHIHKSHLSDPKRLSRLLMAACLAYLWIVYLGTLARVEGWVAIIHRTERCDLSLFQLGLRLLEHFLNEGMPIPVAFTVLLFADEEHAWMEYVR
jgi:Transposase DDE domain